MCCSGRILSRYGSVSNTLTGSVTPPPQDGHQEEVEALSKFVEQLSRNGGTMTNALAKQTKILIGVIAALALGVGLAGYVASAPADAGSGGYTFVGDDTKPRVPEPAPPNS
jgi:hypothetical protein